MLKKNIYSLINFIFALAILFGVLGAMAQLNYNYLKSGDGIIKLFDICLIFAVVVLLCHVNHISSPGLKAKLAGLKHFKKAFLIGLGILTVMWQLYLIWQLTGVSNWDPVTLLRQAAGKKIADPDYFSVYPNNLALLYFEHFVYLLAGKPSLAALTYLMNYLNLILLDGGVLLVFYALKNYLQPQAAYFAGFFGWVLMCLTPWCSLPYSDQYAFFFGSLNVFGFLYLGKHLSKMNVKSYLVLGLLGVLLYVQYTLKPSTIIFFIALALMLLFNLSKANLGHLKTNYKQFLKFAAVFLVPLFIYAGVFNSYKNHNNVVKIDSSRAFSFAHFMAMGVHGNGYYYYPDVVRGYQIKDPKERTKADLKVFKHRLKTRGIWNYQHFAIKKHMATISNGGLSWGWSKQFLAPYHKANKFSKYFFKPRSATYTMNFKFIIQLFWTLMLLGILFSLGDLSSFSILIKLTAFGMMLFLVLFEGGAARYAIQILPYLLVLSGLGYANLSERWRENE